MSTFEMNPDSTMLRQLDGQWQILMVAVLWKLKGREAVTVTHEDMDAMIAMQKGDGVVLLTNGTPDGITFQCVSYEAAERLAAHDAAQRGCA
jgi:hypothetical protein